MFGLVAEQLVGQSRVLSKDQLEWRVPSSVEKSILVVDKKMQDLVQTFYRDHHLVSSAQLSFESGLQPATVSLEPTILMDCVVWKHMLKNAPLLETSFELSLELRTSVAQVSRAVRSDNRKHN